MVFSDANLTLEEAEELLRQLGGAAHKDREQPSIPTGSPRSSTFSEELPSSSPCNFAFTLDTWRGLVEATPYAMLVIDDGGRIVFVNSALEKQFEYAREELLGRPMEILLPERYRAAHPRQRTAFFAAPQPRPMETGLQLFGRRKNGDEFPVEIGLSALQADGCVLGLAVIRDITKRKQAEAQLEKAEARFRMLVEGIPAICFIAGLAEDNNEMYVSPQIEQILGFTQKEWLEDPVLWFTQLHPADKARWQEEFARTCLAGEDFQAEYRFLSRRGAEVWVRGEAKVIRDESGKPQFLHGVAFDISRQKEAEVIQRRSQEELEKLVQARTTQLLQSNDALQVEIAERHKTHEQLKTILHEREALLKEIHHRVKNNLQIISSLLNLQARQLADPIGLEALRESQNRVRLMALLHEKLYRSGDLARIDFRRYVEELITYLFRSYSASPFRISLKLEIGEVFFDIDAAIPCGLIINELVSNSLKYAFPADASGTIRIALTIRDSMVTLQVSDSGPGLPENFDVANNTSLGLHLVRSLAEQLGGAAAFPGPGDPMCVTIQFPDGEKGADRGQATNTRR